MKTFVAAIVILGVSFCVNADLTGEQRQKIQADGKECIIATGISEDVVREAREGKFTKDPKSLAFAGCMAKKLGFHDAVGKAQHDVIVEKLSAALNDPAAAKKLVELCVVENGTPEENAFAATECYYKNTPTHLTIF